MPPRKLMLLMLAAVALGVVLPIVVLKFLRPASGAPQPVIAAAPAVAVAPVPSAPVSAPVVALPLNPAYPDGAVWVTGITRWGRRVWLQMSDGSRVSEEHDELEFVGETFAVIAGRRVPLRPSVTPVPVKASVPEVSLSRAEVLTSAVGPSE